MSPEPRTDARARPSIPGGARAVDVEDAFARARAGSVGAFTEWMAAIEPPLRGSLRRFAAVVDVEVVVQETLLRMWVFARDPERRLEGENASRRFALGVARRVALEEVRRARLGKFVALEDLDDPPEPVTFDPPPADHGLRRAIEHCLALLPAQPRAAIRARIERGHASADRDLAEQVGMRPNTFLQNVVRARALLARCLHASGIALDGSAS